TAVALMVAPSSGTSTPARTARATPGRQSPASRPYRFRQHRKSRSSAAICASSWASDAAGRRRLLAIRRPHVVGIEMPHPAIDTDDLPGEKIRQIGGEKFNDPGAVFRGAETSHRDLRHDFVLDLAEPLHPVHRGPVAWRLGIDL